MGIKFNFTKEQIEETMKSFVQDTEDAQKKSHEIVRESGEDILRRIFKIVERDGALVDESLMYRAEDFDVTEEEYHSLFNAMMEYAGEEREFQDPDNFFEHKLFCYVFNEDDYIELSAMWGQGCVTSFSELSSVKFDSFNISKIVNFDAFMKHMRESE